MPPRGSLRRPAAPRQQGPRRVRAEIQALRAVAVALVVVYHLHPPALPGGYVGVDVFFVISGFLISRHLVQEAAATGRVDLAAFWAGRVRRIAPAALVTTAAVLIAATLLLPRTAAAEVGRTSWWATLSAANWLFAAHAVDYQAQSPDASPFEHFWSLGVEEQFYLLQPLLVLGAAVLARRRGGTTARRVVAPFAIVLAASLACSAWFTATGSPAAYFVTPTRMWELAAGGLLAVLLGDRQPTRALSVALQSAGVGAIAVAAIVFTPATPMPGVAALLPVAGAVAVIAGGDAPGLARVWSLPPVRFVGAVSYSLYLWHWPLIVFVRRQLGDALEPPVIAAVVLGSLLLATASFLLVERPLRRVRIRRPARVLVVGATAVALVLGLGIVPVTRDAVTAVSEADVRRSILDPSAGPAIGWPRLDAAADGTWARPQHVVVPDPSVLGSDLSLRRCTVEPAGTTSPICVRGDPHGSTTVAMVGDSHMRQWGPAIDALGKRHHWRVLTVLHNSCPFNLVPRPLERDGLSHCTEAVRWALPVLRAEHVRVVLTSAYRRSYAAGDTERAAAGFTAMWRTLHRAGIGVVALGDTPSPPSSPLTIDCIATRDPAGCGTTRAAALATVDPLAVAAQQDPDVGFLDPADAFCGTDWCPGVIGNVAVWVDDNHASGTYVRTTVPWLERRLTPLVTAALGARRVG